MDIEIIKPHMEGNAWVGAGARRKGVEPGRAAELLRLGIARVLTDVQTSAKNADDPGTRPKPAARNGGRAVKGEQPAPPDAVTPPRDDAPETPGDVPQPGTSDGGGTGPDGGAADGADQS